MDPGFPKIEGETYMGQDEEINMPQGFRFRPTEEEIFNSYLRPKIMGKKLPCNIVEEKNLYSGDPWNVLDDEQKWQVSEIVEGEIRKKTIYIFTKLSKKAGAATAGKMRKNGGNAGGKEQFVRAAGCGTWDGQTGPREIKNGKEEVIGFRRMLVFEIRDLNPNSVTTDMGHWIMHEYSLPNDDSDYVFCEITRYLKKKFKRKRAAEENKKNPDREHEDASHVITERPLAIRYPAGPIQVLDYKFGESLNLKTRHGRKR